MLRTLDPVTLRNHHAISRLGEPRTEGMAIFAWKDVVTELVYAALYRDDQPQAGLLLGQADTSLVAPYLYVKGFTDIGPFRGAEPFVQELNQSWRPTLTRIRRQAGQRLIGWVHIAPGSGAVLQAEDQLVHRSLFNRPHQVTLIVDPVQRVLAFYGADAEGYLINVGFNLVAPR